MKKVLLVISILMAALLAGVTAWLVLTQDQTGPEIVMDESQMVDYRSGIEKEELLQGVTAVDERDGDVTESLLVESVKILQEEHVAAVTYVAMDSSKNVTRKVWNFSLDPKTETELKSETVETSAPISEDGEQEDGNEDSHEQDGEANSKSDTDEKGDEDGTGSELDSDSEKQALKDQEEKIAALSPEAPRFYLKQHFVTIQVGDGFSKLDWVEDISDDKDARNKLFRDIQVSGELDTHTAGTYELTYYAMDSDGNRSNEEVLTVTVEP